MHEDAAVEDAAPLCARNAMRLAGQSCISVQTVLVHRSLYERFVSLVVAEVKKLKTGDPLDAATDVGTLIDEKAAQRVEAWIAEAVQGGARVLTGGGRRGAQLEPTVLVDVTASMKVVCDEVFGRSSASRLTMTSTRCAATSAPAASACNAACSQGRSRPVLFNM